MPPSKAFTSPVYALRLHGTEADVRAAAAVGARAQLVASPWTVVRPARGAATLLVSDALSPFVAELEAVGADVVRVAALTQRSCEFLAGGIPVRWAKFTSRAVPSFLHVPPVRGAEALPAEALFVGAASDEATRTLAASGRSDYEVGTFGAERALRVPSPLLHPLMRAAEEPRAYGTAYAPSGAEGVWVEWPWRSPVAGALVAPARAAGAQAVCDRKGEWRFAQLSTQSLDARMAGLFGGWRPPAPTAPPRLSAPQPAASYSVRTRLRDVPRGARLDDPSLWLLDRAGLDRLFEFAERQPTEALGRLLISQVEGPRGRVFVLREDRVGGRTPIAPLVSAALGARGYVRVAGVDGLYVPLGRELFPLLRRDALQRTFLLDRYAHVVLAEGEGGEGVFNVPKQEEVPLPRRLTYEPPPRRTELELLPERMVFDWDEVRVEAPPAPREEAAAPRILPPRVRRASDEPARPVPQFEAPEPDMAPDPDADLNAQARALEEALATPGSSDVAAWAQLGDIRARLGDRDEAARAYASALFYGPPDAALAGRLVEVLTAPKSRSGAPGDAFASSGAAGLKVAKVLRGALTGKEDRAASAYALSGALVPDPEAPAVVVPRKLAWAAARAICQLTGDRLGLVRARERLLGAVNEGGLSEIYDMPRFVRFSMAAQAGQGDSANAAQVAALEQTLAAAGPHLARNSPSATAGYLRAVFSVGFSRLGAVGVAERIRAEIPAGRGAPSWATHPVNVALFEAYRRRAAFVTGGAVPRLEAWAPEVAKLASGLTKAENVDRYRWMLNRSIWLRTKEPDNMLPSVRPEFAAPIDALKRVDDLPGSLRALAADKNIFDFEVRTAIEVVLKAALATGQTAVISASLDVAFERLRKKEGQTIVMAPVHRAGALAACVRTAAKIDDRATLTALVAELSALVNPDVSGGRPGQPPVRMPSPRDIGPAVEAVVAVARAAPALAPSLSDFEAALSAAARRADVAKDRDVTLLRAPHIELLRLMNDPRAASLLTAAIEEAFSPPGEKPDHARRFDSAARLIRVTRRWPVASRVAWCETVTRHIDRVTDNSVASEMGIYLTFQNMVLEETVEALVDDQTFRMDQIRAWLGDEEYAFRKKVMRDAESLA